MGPGSAGSIAAALPDLSASLHDDIAAVSTRDVAYAAVHLRAAEHTQHILDGRPYK